MNIFGNNIKFSIFGESHGVAIGGIIDGIKPGTKLDFEKIDQMMKKRNHRAVYSTQRAEADKYEILSGVVDGVATGAPLAFEIRNADTKSGHYSELASVMRPSHADYGAYVKFKGFADYRGGGHFSGRITAPLTFAGAIFKNELEKKGIFVYPHILSIGNIRDKSFLEDDGASIGDLGFFPVTSEKIKDEMLSYIESVRADKNSCGGIVEVAVCGVDAGFGNPFFGSVESEISKMMFSIPAVKGIEFGRGFDITHLTGFEANDNYYYDENKNVRVKKNNNGGIVGGITNGAPIIFRVAVKPTPSIFKTQDTINVKTKENTALTLEGRHDSCIVPRAAAAIEAATAMVIYDIIS